jgi:hypothetical protein
VATIPLAEQAVTDTFTAEERRQLRNLTGRGVFRLCTLLKRLCGEDARNIDRWRLGSVTEKTYSEVETFAHENPQINPDNVLDFFRTVPLECAGSFYDAITEILAERQ